VSQLAATLIGGAFAVAVWFAFFKAWFAFVREMDAGRPQRKVKR